MAPPSSSFRPSWPPPPPLTKQELLERLNNVMSHVQYYFFPFSVIAVEVAKAPL